MVYSKAIRMLTFALLVGTLPVYAADPEVSETQEEVVVEQEAVDGKKFVAGMIGGIGAAMLVKKMLDKKARPKPRTWSQVAADNRGRIIVGAGIWAIIGGSWYLFM